MTSVDKWQPPAPPGSRNRDYQAWLIVCLLTIIFMLPVYLGLSTDEEGLRSYFASTCYGAQAMTAWDYPFWRGDLGLGMPHPFSQNGLYHPLVWLFGLLGRHAAMAWFLTAHMLAGVLSVFALCRKIGGGRLLSACGAATYLLCGTTLNNLVVDFWPSGVVPWTITPLLLWLIIRLLEAPARGDRFVFSILLGFAGAVMSTSGHPGLALIDFAGLGIFLLFMGRKALALVPWLGLSFVIVLLTSLGHVYDIRAEMSLFAGQVERVLVPHRVSLKDLWALFLRPLYWGRPYAIYKFNLDQGVRIISFGGPFALAAIYCLLKRSVKSPYKLALAAGFIICGLAVYFPNDKLGFGIIAWYFLFRDAFTIFAVLLAVLALSKIQLGPGRLAGGIAAGLALLNAVLLAGAALPFWGGLTDLGLRNLKSPQPVISNVVAESRIVSALQDLNRRAPGRVYLSYEADMALWSHNLIRYGLSVNSLALHGLRVVNGYFKGVYLEELYPAQDLMHSWIFGQKSLAMNLPLLNLLNIRYLLAFDQEKTAPGLKRAADFGEITHYPGQRLVLYENPGAWPLAVVMNCPLQKLRDLKPPRLPGCEHDRLLCADASSLAPLRNRADRIRLGQARGDITLELHPSRHDRTVMISEYYRPAWRARGRDAHGDWVELRVDRVVEALMGLRIPAGVSRVELRYRPAVRMALTAVSWSAWLVCYLILAGLFVRWLIRRRHAG